ncbi:hypothetical protein [Chromatocurvus halotolerans]|uniref:Uncharacterized protein n=1 Tax=Chromatocurvus halotolerans TaxID=1132028 RepID=A0A4R2LH12_9GAMM|nr:hypothetical protein [Chromatocurvus halotolerans]TCO78615.1 hypothetical protein EV688_101433 [Chromatocurvus halotolerans]
MLGLDVWALIGFAFAAYAVVGNDALQTLGTFISSNQQRHWTVLFAFAGSVLVVTFIAGWVINNGDPSFGRLSNAGKYPEITVEWYHTLPPLVLLLVTRLGIPVSTTFMVLTIFATVGGFGSMIEKSLTGYALAFVIGLGVYLLISRTLERYFDGSELSTHVPFGLIGLVGGGFFLAQYYLFGTIDDPQVLVTGVGLAVAAEITALLFAFRVNRGLYWVITQWVTTAYLWSIWLVQDFANIFVFLPRNLTAAQGVAGVLIILAFLAFTFANAGGPVQRILRTKTSVVDIRSASIIDFLYASLLFFFKEVSDIPLSTTWVFLGLIAGREYGFALTRAAVSLVAAVIDTAEDAAKAFIGIVISIDLALGLPWLARGATGDGIAISDLFPTAAFMLFVIIANVILLPTSFFAFSRPEEDKEHVRRNYAIGIITLLVIFFAMTMSLAVF